MEQQEKEYIDKKFQELEQKLLNPDPEEALERAKKYRNIYMKRYIKWVIGGALLVFITYAIVLRMVGIF